MIKNAFGGGKNLFVSASILARVFGVVPNPHPQWPDTIFFRRYDIKLPIPMAIIISKAPTGIFLLSNPASDTSNPASLPVYFFLSSNLCFRQHYSGGTA